MPFIWLVLAIVVVVAISMAAALAVGEHNHRLIAHEEGLDPEPADFTDINFTDDDALLPIPERTAEESAEVQEEFLEALANGPGEPMILTEPINIYVEAVEPSFDPVVTPVEQVPDPPLDPPLDPEAGPEAEFATGGIVDVSKVTLIGPGNEIREHPDDPEVVIPLGEPIRLDGDILEDPEDSYEPEPVAEVDIITQMHQVAAAQPATEWKRWNRP